MLEKLGELEGKVLALVKLLQERSELVTRLERENRMLTDQLDATEGRLQSSEEERRELQQQIDGNAARENEIQDRLKSILERISRFETEMSASQIGGFE